MSTATVLELAIGLSFVYLIFSLVVSRINEVVAGWLNWRAKTLVMGLRKLLTGEAEQKPAEDTAAKAPALSGKETLGERLLELSNLKHPLISHLNPPTLFRRNSRLPSYLDRKTFGHAMLDILAPERPAVGEAIRLTGELRQHLEDLAARENRAADLKDCLPPPGQTLSDKARQQLQRTLDQLQLTKDQEAPLRQVLSQLALAADSPLAQVAGTIENLNSHPLGEPLAVLFQEATGDLDRFRVNLEDWFDQAMERVSGFYKRKVQLALVIYALVLAALLNIDTVTLGRSLWTDGMLRQAVVAAAEQGANQTPSDVSAALRTVTELNLPLGWTSGPANDPRRPPTALGGWLLKLLGLLLTVMALSLGSQFWFQLLNRFVNLRSTGPPPPSGRDQPERDEAG